MTNVGGVFSSDQKTNPNKNKNRFSSFLFILVLLPALTTTGCGGGDGTESGTSSTEMILSGSVGDGPIVHARVLVTDSTGAVIAETSSDDGARYRIVLPRSLSYPLLIRATRGVDLVTGSEPDFAMVSATFGPPADIVNVNPFTTLVIYTAQAMPGGLTRENLARAMRIVTEQLNFGLDLAQAPDPIVTRVTADNVASIVKASEALAEAVRRTRDALASSGRAVSADDVLSAIAGDMSDGALDGLGANADPRVAAVATAAAAQVLIESLGNSLKVNDIAAMSAMDRSIQTTTPDATRLTGDVPATPEVLTQTSIAVAAVQNITGQPSLTSVASALSQLPAGALPSEVRTALPVDADQLLGNVTSLAAQAPTADIDDLTAVMRAAGTVLATGTSGGGTGATVGKTVIRINAGGGNYTDTNGHLWSADTGSNTGTTMSVSDSIDGTVDDPLFQTERWDPSAAPELAYRFALPNGDYTVKLYFAEVYSGITAAGQRVFDVSAEGQVALDSLDIFAEAGARTALVKDFPVSVNDGELEISLSHDTENPKISAIEIIEMGSVQTTHSVTTSTDTPTQISVGEGTVTIVGAPNHGTASVGSGGTISFVPDAGYSGTDTITYQLVAPDDSVTLATITVTVECTTNCNPERTLVLSWDAPVDTVLGYLIYLGPTSQDATQLVDDLRMDAGTLDPAAPSIQYASTELGLASGDSVCFRLKAYNSVGESGFSDAACGVIQ